MAVVTLAGIQSGLTSRVGFHRTSLVGPGVGTWLSLFMSGGFPLAGVTPPAFTVGSGYTCDRTMAGSFPFANPTGGNRKYLGYADFVCQIGGTTIVFIDRLWACSGFDTTSLIPQTITTPGIIPPRDINGTANGDGIELWAEVYVATGTAAATWTVTYTNQAGTAGRIATYAKPATAEPIGKLCPFVLDVGDTGVQSVQDFTCSISSGIAGNVGLTLLRQVGEISVLSASIRNSADAISLGLPRLYDDTCLTWMLRAHSSGGQGIILGTLAYVEG